MPQTDRSRAVLLTLAITSVAILGGVAPREAATSTTSKTPSIANDFQDKIAVAKTKTDFFGDPLPPGVVARMGTERLRHASAIKKIIYLSTGNMVSAGDDATVRVWNPESGKELLRLPAGEVWLYDLATSSDGKLIAAAGDAIYIWDAATGKKQHELHNKDPQELVFSIAFTPDGTRLVSGHGDYVYRLWDVASGKLLMSFSEGSAIFPKTAISPNGKTIATTHQDKKLGYVIRFWDADTGEQILKPLACEAVIGWIVFSPDGRSIAAGEGVTIHLWELATCQERLSLHAQKRQILGFSTNGKLLVLERGDDFVRVFDALSGNQIQGGSLAVERGSEVVVSAALSPDGGLLATGSNHLRIRLWDAATGKEKEPLPGHDSHVTALAFSLDGKRVFSGCSQFYGIGSVIAWDAATGKHLRTFPGSVGKHVYSLSLSPDGQTLAAGNDFSTSIWNTATGEEVTRVKGPAFKVAILPGQQLLTSSYGAGTIRSLNTLERVSDVPMDLVAVAPDGQTFHANLNELTLFDPKTKKNRVSFKLPIPKPPKVEVPKGHVLKTPVQVRCAAFSTDGKTLATAATAGWSYPRDDIGPFGVLYAENIYIWDVASGKLLNSISLPFGEYWRHGLIKCLAFSPDGRTLAAGGRAIDNQRIPPPVVLFWDVNSGKEVHQILIPSEVGVNVVGALAFSPDGKTLATGGCDTTVLIWELPEAIIRRPKQP